MSNFSNFEENYIYLYHLTGKDGKQGVFVILPTIPDSFTESLTSSFSTTNVLARSAPIFSYQYSGPRTIQISLSLHRDMMEQLNINTSNLNVEIGEDYVDTLVNYLQSIALPAYSTSSKMVNPPMIAIRFGNQMFIKGVVNGGISTTHKLPKLENGKYAQLSLNFTVSEVDPYDAESVVNQGALRGLSTSLERSLYKQRT